MVAKPIFINDCYISTVFIIQLQIKLNTISKQFQDGSSVTVRSQKML